MWVYSSLEDEGILYEAGLNGESVPFHCRIFDHPGPS